MIEYGVQYTQSRSPTILFLYRPLCYPFTIECFFESPSLVIWLPGPSNPIFPRRILSDLKIPPLDQYIYSIYIYYIYIPFVRGKRTESLYWNCKPMFAHKKYKRLAHISSHRARYNSPLTHARIPFFFFYRSNCKTKHRCANTLNESDR